METPFIITKVPSPNIDPRARAPRHGRCAVSSFAVDMGRESPLWSMGSPSGMPERPLEGCGDERLIQFRGSAVSRRSRSLIRAPGTRHRRCLVLAVLQILQTGCGSPLFGPGLDREPSIPPPRPISTGTYQVGVYYFPGWPTREKWSRLDPFPERVPLLGYYAEGDPKIMDWQIKWAVEHGVSFFVFDWYWDRGRRQLEHALHGGYLNARFRSFLKFCLLWANHNPDGSSSEADLLEVLDHWIAQYFHRPEYFTIDGKPVVIIFSPSLLRK